MAKPATLSRSISPPLSRRTSHARDLEPRNELNPKCEDAKSPKSEPTTLAAIESGKAQIKDHLEYFSKHLAQARRPTPGPNISIDHFRELYTRNQHEQGRHFVIHQHDHPISGVHYDLRLQFSATSTVSFAVPYGMPGNPNSSRPNRMAIETRVHNLWNNLIESASHVTGSLLIWDTGEYEVLPWSDQKAPMTDDEFSDNDDNSGGAHRHDARSESESERLLTAFQSRHIRLRLHGSRLPAGYTVSLRLPSSNDRKDQPRRPKRKRRRVDPATLTRGRVLTETDSDSDRAGMTDHATQASGMDTSVGDADDAAAQASEGEGRDEEDAVIRATNAYTGATNSIGSIHQRHWFLTLDRRNSGFTRRQQQSRSGDRSGSRRWVSSAWEAFFVRGREVERSVVTGRSADEVMEDERVEKFVGRKMWRPIME